MNRGRGMRGMRGGRGGSRSSTSDAGDAKAKLDAEMDAYMSSNSSWQ